jgi:hypothetical protein
MPTWLAKMRFIGFEMTSGATPAEANTARLKATTNFGCRRG